MVVVFCIIKIVTFELVLFMKSFKIIDMKNPKNYVYVLMFAAVLFSVQSCGDCSCDKCDETETTEEKACEEKGCEKEGCGGEETGANDTERTEMTITKVADVKIADTPHKVDVRKIYDQTSATVMHITLQAGESLKPHITPVDAIFYILEGTVDIMVGEETKTVEVDCVVDSPKDIKHCIYNNSDAVAKILVVKAPRQTTSSTML